MAIPGSEQAKKYIEAIQKQARLEKKTIQIVLPGSNGYEQLADVTFDAMGFPIVSTEDGEHYILPAVLLECPLILE